MESHLIDGPFIASADALKLDQFAPHLQEVYAKPATLKRKETTAAVPALACLLPFPGLDRGSLYYYPYPALAVPGFSAALGVATWGLLAPAAAILFGKA